MRLRSRRASVVLHELPDGTHALTDGDRGTMLVVNDVGAAVWLLLDSSRDLEDLVTRLAETLGGEPATVRRDVEAFLRSLAEHELTE